MRHSQSKEKINPSQNLKVLKGFRNLMMLKTVSIFSAKARKYESPRNDFYH